MIKLAVLGSSGRMGQWVMKLLTEQEFRSQLSCVSAPKRGDDLSAALSADVIIDFSSPDALCTLGAQLPPAGGPALVVGSTGWTQERLVQLSGISKKTLVLRGSNFSLGVMALDHLLKLGSPMLARLGFHASLTETHHVHKKDAPSGTAITLAHTVAAAYGSQPTIESFRQGEVIGEHTVRFDRPTEHIELSHSAHDRSIFARGAIEVAIWMAQKRGSSPKGSLEIADFFNDRYL